MIEIVERVPGFVETDVVLFAHGPTWSALRQHDWIARWEEPFGGRPFFRWSIGRVLGKLALMAEHDEGRHWIVVAYIVQGADQLNLPEWVPPTWPDPQPVKSWRGFTS